MPDNQKSAGLAGLRASITTAGRVISALVSTSRGGKQAPASLLGAAEAAIVDLAKWRIELSGALNASSTMSH